LSGALEGMRGIVFNHSCDGARRTYDIFRSYINDIPAVFIDMPRTDDELAISHFRNQLAKFRAFLEDIRGGAIGDDALTKSIFLYNRNRELLRRLYGMIASEPLILRAEELVHVLDMNATMPKDQANGLLEQICTYRQIPKGEYSSAKRRSGRRVFLSGNVFDSLSLLDFIEKCGANIVGDDFCFGGRYCRMEIVEKGDPLTALAEGYLSRIPCGRMENNRDRFNFILDEVEHSGAQGVIYASLKFCDHFLVDYPSLKELLDERGIPSLFVEGEYFSFDTGQIKTRVEAFLEML
jgi:benzoyl-CoA reductase/2-hydroxyglutaryl-CoA dehydratase subunit BcrC/BadD/HgdB